MEMCQKNEYEDFAHCQDSTTAKIKIAGVWSNDSTTMNSSTFYQGPNGVRHSVRNTWEYKDEEGRVPALKLEIQEEGPRKSTQVTLKQDNIIFAIKDQN